MTAITLTTNEAAAAYGMQASHLAHLAHHGRLDAVRVDGVWLVANVLTCRLLGLTLGELWGLAA